MAYNGVRTYTKPHKDGDGTSGGTTIIMGGTANNYDTQTLNVVNINAESADINNINARNIKADNIDTAYIKGINGDINYLNGYTLNYGAGNINQVYSDEVNTKNLNVSDTANIDTIINNNLSSKNIVTDYLQVNKQAHFFELIIDKIRSVQGTQMNTAANCVADYVEAYYNGSVVPLDSVNVSYYRVYWKNKDDDGRTIENEWLVGDQAICQSFNVHTGVNYDVSNKYYWRLVEQVGSSPKYVNLNPEYTSSKKVSNSPINDYDIKINSFSFDTTQDNFTSFTIEAVNGGSWYAGNKIWEPTETTNGLKIYNHEYCLLDGELNFQTRDTSNNLFKTNLNVTVVYDDGTIEYNNTTSYQDTYAITTNANKNVDYFLITTNKIERWEACNWIDLSNTDYDSNGTLGASIPSAGDNICQLGYRGYDTARASAIIIAAYRTPDAGITPPSYAQYMGINDYNLSSHRKTYFDATGAKIYGSFVVDAGGNDVDLDQYILSLQETNPIKCLIINPDDISVELLALQVDNSNQIHDLNAWPTDIVVKVQDNNVNIVPANLDSCYINLFGNDPTYGRTIDILDWDQDTTQDNYEGIYIRNIARGGSSIPIIVISFDWRNTSESGGGQTITSSSFSIYGTYTTGGITYNFSKNIPVITVTSVDGRDAQLYVLDKVAERSYVDNEGTLTTNLKYKMLHVVGTTVTQETPTTQKLRITAYDNTNTIVSGYPITLTSSSFSTYWEHTRTMANWFNTSSMGGKPFYYTVELLDSGNSVLDTSFVNVQLLGTSLFKVEEGLTTSIQALGNDYTVLEQTVNGISSTVGTLGNSVSSIQQQANNIQLSVTDLENGLASSGINVTAHKITLSSANTIIDGDLSLTGNFVSENDTTKNKVTIFTDNTGGADVGINLYGMSASDPMTGEPLIGATQENITKIGFGEDSQTGGKYGLIQLSSAGNTDINSELNEQELILTDLYKRLIIDKDTVQLYSKVNGSWTNGRSKTWDDIIYNRLNVKILHTYDTSVSVLDDIIILQPGEFNSNITVTLPFPGECTGKRYYIKNQDRNRNPYVTCNGSSSSTPRMMNDNNADLEVGVNINRATTMFFSDGVVWIMAMNDY